MKTITLAFTGASGIIYGTRLLECLLQADCRVNLLYSQTAQIVLQHELGLHISSDSARAEVEFHRQFLTDARQLRVFNRKSWFAPIASGSNPADAMVICPCTMGTVAKVAHGLADDLLTRAADVCLKEKRPLIIVPRDTPFSLLHLENLTKLAQIGATILPPNPAFYHHPHSIQDLVDFVVARILDHLKVPHQLMLRWGEEGILALD